MSDSSTGSVNWWGSISVYESDYVPDVFSAGSSVDTNHKLLAGLRDNDFDTTDTDYTYGLMTLALVFLIAGILACCLLPCIYSCLSKSRKERLTERLRIGHQSFSKGNVLLLIAGIAAIATAAGAVWGLEKVDSGLTTIEDNTQGIADDLRVVLNVPNDTSDALEEVSTAYNSLLGADACTNGSVYGNSTGTSSSSTSTPLSSIDIDEFVNEIQSGIASLSADTLDDLADRVEAVSEAVETTRGIRKGLVWPVISLTILLIVVFLVIALGTYNLMACSLSRCVSIANCITPCSIFLAIIIWLSAASAVTMSALSGDFCIDPDTNVEVLLADANEATLTEITNYYAGNCSTNNSIVEGIIDAQETAVLAINSTMTTLYELAEACDELSPYVQDVDTAMYDLWLVLEDAGELSSCENINGPYQEAVYDELCTLVPQGLLGFWVSCVILTVLLIVLAVRWNSMLRNRRTEAQATAIESEQQQQSGILSVWRSVKWSSNSQPGAQNASAPPQRAVEISNPQRVRR